MIITGLNSFKDVHKGEKVFMVGTGPSLTYEMLDQLQGQYTFAMNNISIAYPHTEWRPYYYLNVSRSLLKYPYWQERASESIKAAKHTFYWSRNMIHAMQDQPPESKFTFLSCHTWPVFEKDCWESVSRWGSSMFTALQLVVYMGFSRIYLIGCDLGYLDGLSPTTMKDNFHFDSDYLGDKRKEWSLLNPLSLQLDEIRTVTSHQLTAMTTRRLGRWVFTCSPRLAGIYPLRSFEEALADEGEWLDQLEFRRDYREP